MKILAYFSTLVLSATSLMASGLSPDTELNDVPGTSTLHEIVTAGGGGGGVSTNEFSSATNAIWTATRRNREKDDLAVYRKVKDIWTWTNWENPEEPDARPAPSDFLTVANSPGTIQLKYKAETASWMYANQYWPNGNLKYDSNMPPGGHDGPLSTNLYFKFSARSEDGASELFRFCAKAHRESATDETLINWFEDYSTEPAPVRLATTDLVNHGLEGRGPDVDSQIPFLLLLFRHDR